MCYDSDHVSTPCLNTGVSLQCYYRTSCPYQQCSGPQINHNLDFHLLPQEVVPSWPSHEISWTQVSLAKFFWGAEDQIELSGLFTFIYTTLQRPSGFPAPVHKISPTRGCCCLQAVWGCLYVRRWRHLADLTLLFVLFSLYPTSLSLLPQRGWCRGEVQPQVWDWGHVWATWRKGDSQNGGQLSQWGSCSWYLSCKHQQVSSAFHFLLP